jgi:hypothetical protein
MTQTEPAAPSCTAFDGVRQLASGAYAPVAIAVKEHLRGSPDSSILIFDDESGRQIDFDLRGTDHDITERIHARFPASRDPAARAVGRPKLGVVSREVTLLPQQWEWLAAQSGGASVTLRKLVDAARRAGPTEKVRLRQIHERTYHFMSAMAGNLPNFEEASRALFANDMPELKRLTAKWPADIRKHTARLGADAASRP